MARDVRNDDASSALAAGCADHRSRAQHRAVSGRGDAGRGRPRIDRRCPAGGARQRQIGILMQRNPAIEDPSRTTSTASARSPTSCATSPRPTAPTISSARASSASRSPSSSTAGRSSWPGVLQHPRADPSRRDRGALPQLQSQAIEALQLLPQAPQELVAAIQLDDVARRACRPRRRLHGHPPGGEAGDPRDHRRHRAHGEGLAPAGAAHRGAAPVGRDRPANQGRARRAPARGAAARADGRHPAAARRRRGRQGGEIAELDQAIAKAEMPKEVEEQARKELRRLERMPEAAAEYGMVRTYLDWLIELPWTLPERAADRHRRGAADPRRGPLRPRQDQAAHRRISGGAQARAAGQGADPVLRRPARRRQDLARPVDRPRHGAQVRARQPRRRARRGGDPRPPAHLYRRAARQHHPGHPQGRRARLRDDARRDRQARRAASRAIPPRRCSRCSTPSRTTPSATTTSACRSTCAAWCSSPPPTCSTPSPGPLRDRMEIISLTGYTATRSSRSPSATWCGGSSRRTACSRAGRDHRRRRCARSSSTTRARPACATSSARSARRCAMRRAHRRGPERADPHRCRRSRRHSRARRVRERGRDAHQRARRGHRARLDAGRRRHPVHRGDAHARRRQADPHRPARRRDEGERAGGAQHRQEPRRELGIDRPAPSRRATSTSTCRPARFPRTGRAPASRCSWRSPR